MRTENAVWGGEMSAHHYFRDFYYCDNGMIPWLMIWSFFQSTTYACLSLFQKKTAFPSSGEMNFIVSDPDCIDRQRFICSHFN